MRVQKQMTILFQGDSITDAGRSRTDDEQLGTGYANMVAARLRAENPEAELRCFNRGVGGNRVDDLRDRWDEDAVGLRPDVVSILVGINDVYRAYDGRNPGNADSYKQVYDGILGRLACETDAKIILLEPFLLPSNDTARERIPTLFPYITAARELAAKYRTQYIPLDGIFAAAAARGGCAAFAGDGVHPSQAGHAMIADLWLRAFAAL